MNTVDSLREKAVDLILQKAFNELLSTTGIHEGDEYVAVLFVLNDLKRSLQKRYGEKK